MRWHPSLFDLQGNNMPYLMSSLHSDVFMLFSHSICKIPLQLFFKISSLPGEAWKSFSCILASLASERLTFQTIIEKADTPKEALIKRSHLGKIVWSFLHSLFQYEFQMHERFNFKHWNNKSTQNLGYLECKRVFSKWYQGQRF